VEELGKQVTSNVDLVESLLRTSFDGANISYCKCQLGGKKFKVEAESKKMFLCVSNEYLSDQNKVRISNDYKLYNVAETLAANPEQFFLLGNNGIQRIAAQDVSS
jgi:hypothetical protein